MATSSTNFLGGAKGRLLPAALIFRYFASAVLFHVLAWIALFFAAPTLITQRGGLGWPLAALHLITLGVLVMTAVATSLQLLPVASRQAVSERQWPYDLVWVLLNFGVIALSSAMAWRLPAWLLVGAAAAALALLIYLALMLQNLRGARGMPLVLAHCWAAALSLLVLIGSAAALAGAYSGLDLLERETALTLHLTFSAYGFMGMLLLGFSYILVPMFALSNNPPLRWSYLSLGLALLALALVWLNATGVLPASAWTLAIVAGALALVIHVALMLQCLRSGMRRHLGSSFVLVRVGWLALGGSLLLALPGQFSNALEVPPALFGILLIGGLLTFLLGVLSRIIPFLAAMHAAGGQRRAPTASGLTLQGALDLHFWAHLAALTGLLLALSLQSVWLLRLSAVLGLAGALSYATFFVAARRRMTLST